MSSTTPEIIDENSQYLVLNKPPKWHSSGKSKNEAASVEDWLVQNFPWAGHLPEGGLVHRLDFLTSGCLLVAKSETEQHRLREALAQNFIRKIYWALARKALPAQGEFELSFESRYKSSKKISVSRNGGSTQKGRCRWRRLGKWQWPSAEQECKNPLPTNHPRDVRQTGDFLEVELLGPGKRHQIRAGLAFLGADLFGDPLYGLKQDLGLGLHARELCISPELSHEGKERRVQAETPDFWEYLGLQTDRNGTSRP